MQYAVLHTQKYISVHIKNTKNTTFESKSVIAAFFLPYMKIYIYCFTYHTYYRKVYYVQYDLTRNDFASRQHFCCVSSRREKSNNYNTEKNITCIIITRNILHTELKTKAHQNTGWRLSDFFGKGKRVQQYKIIRVTYTRIEWRLIRFINKNDLPILNK